MNDTPSPAPSQGSQVGGANGEAGWQPIETAPKDRTVEVTDGLIYGAAQHHFYIEPLTIGYGVTLRPNPNAGLKRDQWWAVAGWSAWLKTEWEDGEYDSRCPRVINPTHWRPLPLLPESKE